MTSTVPSSSPSSPVVGPSSAFTTSRQTTDAAAPDARFVARTVELTEPLPVDGGSLIDLLPAEVPAAALMSWVRGEDGLVGWGRVAQVRTSGPARFADAQRWWDSLSARIAHDDGGVEITGSGPLAFGSFAYSATSGQDSVLVVPAVIVGHREGRSWMTTITPVEAHPEHDSDSSHAPPGAPSERSRGSSSLPIVAGQPPAGPGAVTYAPGALDASGYARAVADAVQRIADGGVDKAVLARDLCATTERRLDPRHILRRLAADYPRTWVFSVDGLVGATPEMLLRLERGLVTSRVLAGTIRRTGHDEQDLALAGALARSSKDLEEHEYAVRSVADALAPHCTSMAVPESPTVLHLPNVMHLATDLAGRLRDGLSPMELVEALHPSAAVCGTPRDRADELISELEGIDRGRYAGPVGWMDMNGNADWGIALRCGALDPADAHRIRLFAGCGIVAGSDPEAEVAETEAKFLPMRQALEG